jgi:penicillin-binding protein 1A
MQEGGGEALPLSQPQQMLQPDITLLPRSGAARTPEQASKLKEPGINRTTKPADAANNKDSSTNKTADQVQQLLNPH